MKKRYVHYMKWFFALLILAVISTLKVEAIFGNKLALIISIISLVIIVVGEKLYDCFKRM
jgi:hypothetical protein